MGKMDDICDNNSGPKIGFIVVVLSIAGTEFGAVRGMGNERGARIG
jgi:hypothetical protein